MNLNISMTPLTHHPIVTGIKCYPQLGQKLTDRDVGKYFVRVYPYCDSNIDAHIWYYMPHGKDVEKVREYGLKLLRFEYDDDQECIITEEAPLYRSKEDSFVKELVFSQSWNDGYWANVENLIDHIKNVL